ncbi:MAG: SDR family oxidoreductase [Gemmatimonadetes bacterium]|nr:SDR family oxidoreductase [Gemmatimonadota bacterium]
MRYLITGGAGFIGSHLVERLIEQGEEVVVLDDLSTGRRENLAPFEGSFELIEGSVTDPAACARAARGADFVLHHAALGSVPRSIEDPVATHEVNATGTLNVLKAALEARVRRVVYAASSSAYGDTDELPKHEGMVPRPRSPYAVAKLSGEEYCRAFHASYGLGAVALRYFNVFGPRQDPESQYAAVIPRFATAALAARPATIYGDGEQSRDFTFVGNVVRANLLATTAPKAALGEVYNVGAGDRTTVNQLWQHISGLAGVELAPEYREARAGDVRHSLASLDRSGRLLGYAPEVDVLDGLHRTVEWYRTTAASA